MSPHTPQKSQALLARLQSEIGWLEVGGLIPTDKQCRLITGQQYQGLEQPAWSLSLLVPPLMATDFLPSSEYEGFAIGGRLSGLAVGREKTSRCI
jgi:hypothetical protein